MNFATMTMKKRCQQRQKRAESGRLFAIPFWNSIAPYL